jgi:hypothetical protein
MTFRFRGPMDRHPSRNKLEEADALRPHKISQLSVLSQSVGAIALGAIAIGALAIGALAIGRLAIGRARIRRLEIDEIVVRRLRVIEDLQAPPKAGPES